VNNTSTDTSTTTPTTTQEAPKNKNDTKSSKQNNDNASGISQKIQQTASARDYYKEASFRHFTEMVDTKFWQTVEKRKK